jgi:diguanylate cyclase (GGDEF)-like protein/PAS domain S-box-containing protein
MGEIDRIDSERLLGELGYSVLCVRSDEELTIAYAGEPFYEALGFRDGEITALLKRGEDTVLRNEPPIDWKRVRDEIRKNGYAELELRLIKKNGHHIWAAFRTRLFSENGKEYFCGILNDITLTRRSRRIQREQAEELEALTANVPGGVLCCRADENMTLNLVSSGFCRITGYTAGEIAERFGNRFIEIVYPEDRGRLMLHLKNCTCRNDITEITFRIVGKDGNVMWVLDKARCTADCSGNLWVYSVLIDITGMKKAQDELAASEERYRLILEHVADPVLDCNFKTQQLYYSPTFLQKFGDFYPDHGDILEIAEKSGILYDGDRDALRKKVRELSQAKFHEKDFGNMEFRLRDRNGKYLWCSIHAFLFNDGMGEPERMIAVVSDIDRQKRENIDLRRKAEHDLLTGLYNRVTTTAMVDGAIARSGPGQRHALFVIDIDNFKLVNDSLGHLCGDQLIVETAGQIRRQFREDDVVGRVGGDEFVIFLKNVTSGLVLNKAGILQRMFAELQINEKVSNPISGSIGVSFYPIDGRNYEELFRKADAAMYAAKNSGKNAFRIYVHGIEAIAHGDVR